jgi:hypothetical protein
MAEKYLTMRIDEQLHKEFKIRSVKEGMTLIEALNEAVQDWLDKKLDEESAALAAGTGSLRQSQNKAYKTEIENLKKKHGLS